MICPIRRVFPGMLILLFAVIHLFPPSTSWAQDDYSFEFEEFEPKSLEWGGYGEIKGEHSDLDPESAFYRLNFSQDPRSSLHRLTGTLQLEGSYKKGIWVINGVLWAEGKQDDIDWTDNTAVFEANLSIKPTASVTFDLGKRVFKWGKGYAWNPVGFIDRSKDPNNPEESLEGYIGAGVDLIKSFDGALQTVALTTVVLPVWRDVNEDFGEVNHVNLAAKLYLLYRDTDIDIVVLTGSSRSTNYGIDFSTNLATNFEIHGELAYLSDIRQKYLSEAGTLAERKRSVTTYLLGLRYLTESDITTILEFYHNGNGYSEPEQARFFQLVADGEAQLLNTGTDTLFQTAKDASKVGYGKPQAGRNYLYLKISQKEPFDILYFTPGLTTIVNLDDLSYSLSPELSYSGFTNWELRSRFTILNGSALTEFKEKQNEYKLELRVRYHF